MPSSHLILCRPLLLLPPIPPSIRVFSNESTLRMRWPKYWSISFSIIPSKEIPGLISFRMDWLDLLAAQGTLKSLLQHHSSKTSILRHSAFFIINSNIHTWLLEKPSLWLDGPLLAKECLCFLICIYAKSWLIGKDSDAGRDWGQEEKETKEDEMAGWHHWLDGHESEWTPGVGDGQGSLACCDSWGRKEWDTTERLIWSDLICTIEYMVVSVYFISSILKFSYFHEVIFATNYKQWFPYPFASLDLFLRNECFSLFSFFSEK